MSPGGKTEPGARGNTIGNTGFGIGVQGMWPTRSTPRRIVAHSLGTLPRNVARKGNRTRDTNMERKNRESKLGTYLFVASVLLLPLASSGLSQTVSATIPLDTNPVYGVSIAVNPNTNRIYIALCGPANPDAPSTNGHVVVIDGDSNTATPVPAGICPTAVAVNTVTNKIYVANQGRFSLFCGPCNDPGGITVIDGATNSASGLKDPNAAHPRAVAVNAVTNKIYFANSIWPSGDAFTGLAGNITVLDASTGAMTTVADPNAVHPNAVGVDTVTNEIYISNGGSNNITVLDGATNSTSTINDPKAIYPKAMAVNEDNHKIYVANFGEGVVPATNPGNVTVIDGASHTVIATIATTAGPGATPPLALAVNPANDKVYVANNINQNVVVIDGSSNSSSTISDPSAVMPRAVAVNPATNRIYVANGGGGGDRGSITVIDGAGSTPTTSRDPHALNPRAVAVNPATNKVYVVNDGSSNVTVFDGGAPTNFALTLNIGGNGSGRVTSVPPGIDCRGSCAADFPQGAVVILTASADSDAIFSGWSGACSGPGTCSVTLSASAAVTATFTAPSPDFTLVAAAAGLILKRGGHASDTLASTSQAGFSGNLALACAVGGPSPKPTCSVFPNSVAVGSSVTLTVDASTLTAGGNDLFLFDEIRGLYAAGLPIGILGFLLARGVDKRRRWTWMLCTLMLAAILPAACGGNTTQGPPPQHYTVTVTASAGTIQHSSAISVTVE
jgi:DNA-binding beta-propeller fold protein YncE